jgi:hypothetical protein
MSGLKGKKPSTLILMIKYRQWVKIEVKGGGSGGAGGGGGGGGKEDEEEEERLVKNIRVELQSSGISVLRSGGEGDVDGDNLICNQGHC